MATVATHGGSPLEPAGDGVPGQPFDPGNRRQTAPLDAQRDDTVERRSAMLEAVIASCENSLAIKCPRKPWGAGRARWRAGGGRPRQAYWMSLLQRLLY